MRTFEGRSGRDQWGRNGLDGRTHQRGNAFPQGRREDERNKQARVTCNFCGKLGHMMRECRLVTCFNCNRKGHLSAECRAPRVMVHAAVAGGREGPPPPVPPLPPTVPQQVAQQEPKVEIGDIATMARAAKELASQLQSFLEPKKIFPYF